MKKTSCYLLLSALLLSPLRADEPMEAPFILPELAAKIEKHATEYGMLLAKASRSLDEDGDGRVHRMAILQALMATGFTQEGGPIPQVAVDQGWDHRYHRAMADADRTIARGMVVDNDGMLSEKEWITSFYRAIFEAATRRYARQDVNQDGKLTLKEYATGIPIREGQVADEEGYTPIQRAGFARADKNDDGFFAGEEWLSEQFVHQVEEVAHQLTIGLLINRLDTDEDGVLSKAEMLEGLSAYPADFPAEIPLAEALHYVRVMPHDAQHELMDALVPKS